MPMPSDSSKAEEEVKKGFFQYATAWGGTSPNPSTPFFSLSNTFPENAVPPTLTAALITAQHLRPFQTLPMLFPPILLFSSYLNLNDYKKDAAGLTSAWSAAYLVLARRRRQGLSSKFGARGIVRGATIALCLVNVVSGGLVYAFGKREEKEE